MHIYIYMHVCEFVRKSAHTIKGFEKLQGSHLHTEKPEEGLGPRSQNLQDQGQRMHCFVF